MWLFWRVCNKEIMGDFSKKTKLFGLEGWIFLGRQANVAKAAQRAKEAKAVAFGFQPMSSLLKVSFYEAFLGA